jgi:predicted  nucleic acid-binding Zn-ribbon protein
MPDMTPQEQYDALRRLYEQAIADKERLQAQRGELEGQIIQMGSELVRLRELLTQVVQEVNLADLSPALRHAIERERENERETL